MFSNLQLAALCVGNTPSLAQRRHASDLERGDARFLFMDSLNEEWTKPQLTHPGLEINLRIQPRGQRKDPEASFSEKINK